jgi:hypothetical protein
MHPVQFRRVLVPVLISAGLFGCSNRLRVSSSGGSSNTAPVILTMTDTPPTGVSILAAQVMLTGAKLNPGDVSVLPAMTTVELTRLQTDVAYLGTTLVSPGSYTSVTLTFANPTLTFENDTGSAIVAGVGTPTPTCAAGAICTIQSVATNLSATISLTAFTATSGVATGLLADVSLNDLLSATLGADFVNGVTVTSFTPGGIDTPPVGAEDVVGRVASIDAANHTFLLQNAAQQFSLTVDGSSLFFQFPSSACSTADFSCLQQGQVLSVDIGLGTDGTAIARNVVFEDADSTEAEVEGIVTSMNLASNQFSIVAQAESSAVSGLAIGDVATVRYSAAPQTSFDVDFVHADNAQISTSGFLFGTPSDLVVGQQVLVKQNASSSGTTLTADRVRLRSSRITGLIQNIGDPFIYLGGPSPSFPSLFIVNGVGQIQVQTFPLQTIFTGATSVGIVVNNITQLAPNNSISVRGPLFNVNGTRTLLASKVVLKP